MYKSKLVSLLDRTYKASPYDFCTLERYYENALENVTLNSSIAYNHKHHYISDCYIMDCINCHKKCRLFCNDKIAQVLNSTAGEKLYKWIKNNASE